jgi:oligoribonuclease
MGQPDYLLWLDLETTGSDVEEDCIIEIGCHLTTRDLEFVTYNTSPHEPWTFDWLVEPEEGGWSRVFKNSTVHAMHSDNNLIDDITGAWHTGLELKDPYEVADILIEELERLDIKSHKAMLAGSGVAHFDSRFLHKHMPQLMRYLAYPVLDVGVLRRAFQMWAPHVPTFDPFEDGKPHRALADVKGHIEEARFYQTIMDPGMLS